MVTAGIERLSSYLAKIKGARVGAVVNQTSVDRNFCHLLEILASSDTVHLIKAFSVQHGLFSELQDNMVESEDYFDKRFSLPVFSLYGKRLEPTDELLSDIDVLFYDIQDVGARYYTFIWSLAGCMKVSSRTGTKVVVLDRPNPIGGEKTEGGLVSEELISFVGMYPVPIRYALTVGELAMYLNSRFGIGCELEIIPLTEWRRWMYYDDTGIAWVLPSPNMPSLSTAIVYPGACLLEGTNISEGRGTTLPFELFGAPYIEPRLLIERVKKEKLCGFAMREHRFRPTFGKYKDELCFGAQLYVTDRGSFEPVLTYIAIIKAARHLFGDSFAYRNPPYEYDYTHLPFDILSGDEKVREMIDADAPIGDFRAVFQRQILPFQKEVKEFLLYE